MQHDSRNRFISPILVWLLNGSKVTVFGGDGFYFCNELCSFEDLLFFRFQAVVGYTISPLLEHEEER